MTDILLALMLVGVSYLDGVRDKTRDDPKWRKPYFFIPITGGQVDRHKLVKWLAFYPPLIYILAQMWPNVYLMAGTVIAAAVAWKLHPAPEHWRK